MLDTMHGGRLFAILRLEVREAGSPIRRPEVNDPPGRAAVRNELRQVAARAGVRRRFAPHQLRHAHALEVAREGVPLNTIQRQPGHSNLGTTSIYLQGIDPEEIIGAVRARRAPMMSASAGLRLKQANPQRSAHALPLFPDVSRRVVPGCACSSGSSD
jgi:Phage integrase family